MRIYIAAPWDKREVAVQAAAVLEAKGYIITHKWWEAEKGEFDDGYKAHTHEELVQCAVNDVRGVMSANALVVFNCGVKSEGKAWEQGIALAERIPIIVVSEDGSRLSIFQRLPQVHMVRSLDGALMELTRLRCIRDYGVVRAIS